MPSSRPLASRRPIFAGPTFINGGEGTGSWWWCHFGLIGILVVFSDAAASTRVNHGFTLSLVSLLSTVVTSLMLTPSAAHGPLIAPPGDVCEAGRCCIARATGSGKYLPYAPNITVPLMWEPYLPWSELIDLLILAALATMALLVGACCALRLSVTL